MNSPEMMAGVLIAVGAILMVAELLLPTHGLLGAFGLMAIGGAIVSSFMVNAWLGLGVLVAAVVAAPFAWAGFVKLWPRTMIGRRLVLPEAGDDDEHIAPVGIGRVGVALSDLRPGGECEIDGVRLPACTEHGMIPAGRAVKVIAVADGRAIVSET